MITITRCHWERCRPETSNAPILRLLFYGYTSLAARQGFQAQIQRNIQRLCPNIIIFGIRWGRRSEGQICQNCGLGPKNGRSCIRANTFQSYAYPPLPPARPPPPAQRRSRLRWVAASLRISTRTPTATPSPSPPPTIRSTIPTMTSANGNCESSAKSPITHL